MSGFELRDYQADLVERTRVALRSHSRVLLSLATGGGKTVIAAHMIEAAASRGHRVMFVVHRAELVSQTSAALTASGIGHGVIAPGYPMTRAAVQVASIATVARRLDRIDRPDMLYIDEAHHAAAKSWSTTIAALAPRWTIGLSATPCRLDGRGLDDHFDVLVPGPAVADLIGQGALSPYRLFAPAGIAMDGAATVAGDFSRKDLAARADKPKITGDAVDHYLKLAAGKRAVVFCVSIDHAQHTVAAFRARGVQAAHVDGTMDPATRRILLGAFAAGETPVLASVDLVSEGFDLPAIECAISLRPTQSAALWLQQIGRALRTCPGKTEALILDHAGNVARHGLPDTPREWTLAGRAKGEKAKAPAIVTCGQCEAVYRPAPACPSCGHVRPATPREVVEVAGELAEVDPFAARAAAKSEVARATTRDDLARIARERGYKPGWVAHIVASRAGRKFGARA